MAGFLSIRKALNQAIGLLTVFSYIRLRRCCRLSSSVTGVKDETKTVARNEVECGYTGRRLKPPTDLTEPQGIIKKTARKIKK